MPGIEGAPLGAPSQAEPLGKQDHPRTTAPVAAHAGRNLTAHIEGREQDATERFFQDTTADDAPDEDVTWTERHVRPF